jgi:hypothetical protein
MNLPHQGLERQKLNEIASEYAAQGYRVIVEPQGASLPDFLEGFRPDLIAVGPKESVIVEVKVGTRTASTERYGKLAQLVQQHPGWRFSLVIVDPRSSDEPPTAASVINRPALVRLVEQGNRLAEAGERQAAVLVLWSAAEAAMRGLAAKAQLPIERAPTTALMKELYSLGMISREALASGEAILATRNSVAHGFEARDIDDALVRLRRLVADLVAETDKPADAD